MDGKGIGNWLVHEARLSFKYWHSSQSCRYAMKPPFFDRNQCQRILEEYDEKDEDIIA